MIHRTVRPRAAAVALPGLTGLAGIAVLAVMMQSSGGFSVELLGPDMVLAVAGFAVTHAVLSSGEITGPATLLTWYRRQLGWHGPLLVIVTVAVLAGQVFTGPLEQAGEAVTRVLAGLLPTGDWSQLASFSARADRIDPLGSLWLVILLIQFTLVWPVLLVALHRLVRAHTDGRVLVGLTPLLLGLTIAAWLVGPLRALTGAHQAELAFGAHTRAAEWLVGATAAAAALGLRARQREGGRLESVGLVLVGITVLVTMAILATHDPAAWMRVGGPGGAAFGMAVLLLAVHVPGGTPIAHALGRGLPAELGRMIYPLLLLHGPVFWVVQAMVPGVRPFAILVVGGAISWMLGLLLQDGVVQRLRSGPRPAIVLLTGTAVAAAVAVGGGQVAAAQSGPQASEQVVLVLGGTVAGDYAVALGAPGLRYRVVDGTRPGCGLLDPPVTSGWGARTTAMAQDPPSTWGCVDRTTWWRTQVEAADPDAIVVDLSADAAYARACDPAFRMHYRAQFARALAAWTEGAPVRRVLLATVPDEHRGGTVDGSSRCFNALVTEAAASHRAVTPLDVGDFLCPGGFCRTTTGNGHPLYAVDRLSQAGVAELGPWLEQAISSAFPPRP